MAYYLAQLLIFVFCIPVFILISLLFKKEGLKSLITLVITLLGLLGLNLSPIGSWLLPTYSQFEISDVFSAILGIRGLCLLAGFMVITALVLGARQVSGELKSFAKIILFFLAFLPCYFLWQSINTNAIADDLADKAGEWHSNPKTSAQFGVRYLKYVKQWVGEDKRLITPSQLVQIEKIADSSIGSLSEVMQSESTSAEKYEVAYFVKTFVGQTSALCTLNENLTLEEQKSIALTEQLIGSTAKKLSEIGESCLVPYSTNNCANKEEVDAVLSSVLDFAVEKYLARTQRYLETGCVMGARQAIANYPTMRRMSVLTQGKKIELDLALIEQCVDSVKNGKSLAQIKLFLRGMKEVIPASDFSLDNQERLTQAVRLLLTLTPNSTPTKERKQIKEEALLVLEQWKKWSRGNGLRQISNVIDSAIKSERFDIEGAPVTIRPARMRLDVYVGEIKLILQDIQFHRGSFERVRPRNPEESNLVLQYHQLARRIEAARWNQLENVPVNPEVTRLQSSLRNYFNHADKVFENQKRGRLKDVWVSQQRADMAMSHCIENLAILKKKISSQ